MFESIISSSTIQAIKEAMIPVAEKIGQGGEYAWTILIKQQYVTAALGAFWAIMGLILIIVAIHIFKKMKLKSEALYEKEDYQSRHEGESWFAGALFVLIPGSIAGTAAFITGTTYAITHFLNPDFYAIKFLISVVSGNPTQ